MKGNSLLLLALAAVVAFLFMRQSQQQATALPAPPAANPVGGHAPGGGGDVFSQIMGFLTSAANAVSSVAQTSAKTS